MKNFSFLTLGVKQIKKAPYEFRTWNIRNVALFRNWFVFFNWLVRETFEMLHSLEIDLFFLIDLYVCSIYWTCWVRKKWRGRKTSLSQKQYESIQLYMIRLFRNTAEKMFEKLLECYCNRVRFGVRLVNKLMNKYRYANFPTIGGLCVVLFSLQS